MIHHLYRTSAIKKPLEEVFDFFCKAENLSRLTPPHVNFKIITPLPITMKVGTLIDYQIRLYGIPFSWRTKITKWQPPFLFEDSQLNGPYKTWIHTHHFEEKNGEVFMHDDVNYESKGGIFEPFIQAIFVKRNVEKIFDYRDASFKEIFV